MVVDNIGSLTMIDWIAYGRRAEIYGSKALVRRWLREAREHRPIIDRWRTV